MDARNPSIEHRSRGPRALTSAGLSDIGIEGLLDAHGDNAALILALQSTCSALADESDRLLQLRSPAELALESARATVSASTSDQALAAESLAEAEKDLETHFRSLLGIGSLLTGLANSGKTALEVRVVTCRGLLEDADERLAVDMNAFEAASIRHMLDSETGTTGTGARIEDLSDACLTLRLAVEWVDKLKEGGPKTMAAAVDASLVKDNRTRVMALVVPRAASAPTPYRRSADSFEAPGSTNDENILSAVAAAINPSSDTTGSATKLD